MALSAIVAPHERQVTKPRSLPQPILIVPRAMIPLRDIIPSRTTPWVTYSIFRANIAVFLYTIMLPERDFERLVLQYGLTPAAFSWISALTSTFIHADILHVASNMLCLW